MGKIAFSIGFLNFSWFGLILSVAIIIAYLISLYHIRLHKANPDNLLELMLYGIPVGIIAARIYYVMINWPLYADAPNEIFQIWHGGLAIHGALIGVTLTILIYSKVNKISFWRWADLVAPGLILGHAIGQWGNFINQDAFGYPTEVAWGIYIDYIYRPIGYEQFDFFHPIFLYESAWNLLVFFIVFAIGWVTAKKPNKIASGSLFLLYIILFSAGHAVIEQFRLDSEMLNGWRLAQIMSAISIVLGGTLLFWRNKLTRNSGRGF